MPNIFWRPEAEDDLLEIWLFIAEDSPQNADQYVDYIKKRCENLAEFPDVGRDREELAPGLQSFPIDNYVLFYKAIDDGIDIVRVLNAARDIPALF